MALKKGLNLSVRLSESEAEQSKDARSNSSNSAPRRRLIKINHGIRDSPSESRGGFALCPTRIAPTLKVHDAVHFHHRRRGLLSRQGFIGSIARRVASGARL